MAYADFDFYCNSFLGNAIEEDNFPRLAEHASDFIRGLTRGVSDSIGVLDLKERDALRKATCAVAEVCLQEENILKWGFSSELPVASETVGNWSRAYRDPTVSHSQVMTITERKREAVRIYLAGLPRFKEVFGTVSFPCFHRAR